MQNIQQAIKQAQVLQQKISELQKKLGEEIVEGSAGGNLVKIMCSCKGDVKQISIDPSALDDVEMLQDLIVAAFNNAKKNADNKSAEEMAKLSAAAGIPMDLLNSAF